MAGKATAKPKAKEVKKEEPKKDISMTYIDDILLRLDSEESNIDGALEVIDEINMRTKKVEVRLGID